MENTKKKLVVYTCITNDYDTLREIPRKVFDSISDSVSFICFTDNPELYSDSKTWTIRELPEDLVRLNKVKAQRILKIAPFRYVDDISDISLWVDSNLAITESPLDLLTKCDLKKYPLWTFKHPQRNCIYDEELAVVRLKKEKLDIATAQIEKYMKDRYPIKNGLAETNMILRRHDDPVMKKMSYMWAKEVIDGSHRDQLSFNYCCWKTGLKYGEFDKKTTDKMLLRLPHKSPEKPKGETEEKKKEEEEIKSREKTNKNCYDLIVAFTTYRERIALNSPINMLKSIEQQKFNGKFKIVCTLLKSDLSFITDELKKYFEKNNVEIITCDDDIKAHKKYFYAMQKYKDVPIVLVDDDLVYANDLLQTLYDSYLTNKNVVHARRTHLITMDKNGKVYPYEKFLYEYKELTAPSHRLFLTSGAGTLFPPNIMSITPDDFNDVCGCLYADDVWINSRLNKMGIMVKYVNGSSSPYLMTSAATNSKALYKINIGNGLNSIYINKYFNTNKKSMINVVLISDSARYEQCLLTAKSMLKNKSPRTTVILTLLIPEYNVSLVETFNKLQSDSFFVDFKIIPKELMEKCMEYNKTTSEMKKNSASSIALTKFEIPNLLKHLDRVLYLDTDIYVAKDIRQIYNSSLGDKPLGAVPDIGGITLANRKDPNLYEKRKCKDYVNSGLLLMDLKKMRDGNYSSMLWEAKKNLKDQQLTDQNAFNIVFENNIKLLPMRYNCLIYSIYGIVGHGMIKELNDNYHENYKDIHDIEKDTVIFHFAGRQKPWNKTMSTDYATTLYNGDY